MADWDFWGLIPILWSKKIQTSKISVDIISKEYVLNVAVKYLWQRCVMEAGHLRCDIPDIKALSKKHFI